MNLNDEEWHPDPTEPALLQRLRDLANSCTSRDDLAHLRSTLLASPYNGAIPHELRGTIWTLLLDLKSDHLLAVNPNHFAHEARRAVTDDNAREQIEKDVKRTRPALQRFKQPAVRNALLRLLSLFCQKKEVAYVQGFNELLAPFVLLPDTGSNPRIVYALFDAFISKFAPWMLESSESSVFDVLLRMFNYFGRLLLYHDPELYWLLERLSMNPDLYATSWFVTLFARNFTVECVLALWDLLLLENNPLGTLYFGIALLRSQRDKLLSADESTIPERLMHLSATSPEEVRILWRIGSTMRTVHTPPSFQKLMTERLLSRPETTSDGSIAAARAMQSSVCLQTTPEDLVAGGAKFFAWDCRTEAEYNAGHLAQAAFLPLDALRTAKMKIDIHANDARTELQHAVDMCEPLRNKSHICLIGSGNLDEDNRDVNMLTLYLTRIGVPYVSTLRGGFKGALEAALSNEKRCPIELVDYSPKRHQQARKMRMEKQRRRRTGSGQFGSSPTKRKARGSTSSDASYERTPSSAQGTPFLERNDADISSMFRTALSNMGFRSSPSSATTTPSRPKNAWADEKTPSSSATRRKFNPFSPNSTMSPGSSVATSVTNTPAKRLSTSYPTPASNSNINTPNNLVTSALSWNGAFPPSPSNSATSLNLQPPTDSANSANSPSSGLKSPSTPRTPSSALPSTSKKEPAWGFCATPGWLRYDKEAKPIEEMPAGYTVNTMDEGVMDGLTLFPCRTPANVTQRHSGVVEFLKRFVGVSEYFMFLLAPVENRSHVLEVKFVRYLEHIQRVTFKKSRPELVTFLFQRGPEDDPIHEAVMCLMAEGLLDCAKLIKNTIDEMNTGANNGSDGVISRVESENTAATNHRKPEKQKTTQQQMSNIPKQGQDVKEAADINELTEPGNPNFGDVPATRTPDSAAIR